jgi:hypothetical protein
MKIALLLFGSALLVSGSPAGPAEDIPQWRDLFNGKDLTGWVNVNCAKDTWSVRDGMIVCTGKPIGVMRTDKMYENFVLHIEWMHLEAGGNSGCFAWSDAVAKPNSPFPRGLEIQMLELEWPKLNPDKDGKPRDVAYVSGELFGVGGNKLVPDNPRGERSKSWELRCKGKNEWNIYDVVAVDGVMKLSINGKFVNGISKATQRKGYLCLESEGSPIHFRNIKILELPPGMATPEQTGIEAQK